jgi:uncharacterized protein (DUF2267 family)
LVLQEHFSNDARVEAEEVARAVFRVLTNYITAGEIEDIRQALPRELNTLWLADAWLAG